MPKYSKALCLLSTFCFALMQTGCLTVKHMDSLSPMPIPRTHATLIQHSKNEAVLWGGIENNAAMADPDNKVSPKLDLKYGSWSHLHAPYPPSTFNYSIQKNKLI